MTACRRSRCRSRDRFTAKVQLYIHQTTMYTPGGNIYSPDYYSTSSGNVNCKIFTYEGIVIGLGQSQGKSFPSSTSHSHLIVELQNLSAVLYSQTILLLSQLNRVFQLNNNIFWLFYNIFSDITTIHYVKCESSPKSEQE